MTVYYRVSLEKGIEIEEQELKKVAGKRKKVPYYSDSDELGSSVFKNVRAAKKKLDAIAKAEIKRINDLRLKFRPLKTREEIIAGTELASHVD